MSDPTKTEVATFFARKIGLSPVRGLLRMPFTRTRFPFFVGRGVSILNVRSFRGGSRVYIGNHTVISAFSRRGVALGNHVTIREHGWIQCTSSPKNPGEGLAIEDNVYIGPRAVIGAAGFISVGRGTQAGSGLTLIAENHVKPTSRTSADEVTRKGITIGPDCWLGHNVTVLDGVSLGAGCTVGAGAVVTRSFPAGSVLVGSPAQNVARA